MNDLSRRSYIQFLLLYLLSSLSLLAVASYYFYSSKVSMEIQNAYYKMSHIADMQGLQIIDAHMHKKPLQLLEKEGCTLSLYDQNGVLRAGKPLEKVDFSHDFYTSKSGVSTLVSQSSAMHLGIKYVVVQTRKLHERITQIRNQIVAWTILIAALIVVIAVGLSAMFLRPLKQKAQQIERFVRDMTHELNTPLSALMMSLERLKSKRCYDERTIQNITISTKNLCDIYDSLTFISFDHPLQETEELDLREVLKEQCGYFKELLEKKSLYLECSLQSKKVHMAPVKAKLLLSNLLSNAIKYSHPHSKITITLQESFLQIQDEGIGIDKEKLQKVFERFVRANDYAGGFGVGLSIVKSIADEYGFEIDIDSAANQGTTVTVRF